MLVTQERSAGTIGGGHLELEATALAREMLKTQHRHKTEATNDRPNIMGTDVPDSFVTHSVAAHPVNQLSKHFSLGPSLGQCCGGAVDLEFEMLNAAMLNHWPADPVRFTLALFGAGHVGRAIANTVALLPCQLIWIDEREQEFPSLHPNQNCIEIRCVDTPSAEMKTLPTGSFVIVTTHSHDLDLELCEAALSRSDLGFIGLIGSETKKARFLNRLAQRNIPRLERLVCPIGLSSILGKEPQVIAASVAAQLLQLSSI
jgi:xanthine dehydrogenase accessory factor